MPEATHYRQYELLRREGGSLWELGRGAMGITYKAFDTNLRRSVALKVINGLYLENEAARGRFLREARAAAALRHPNVASVFDLGTDHGNHFYVMEFIDGETVEACVKRKGPFGPAEALLIALQVARALGAAHREKLVHRDLKPSNLMLVDQEGEASVKVIDFGLAKSVVADAEDPGTLTAEGALVGTPHFASPEQIEGGEVDIRSDIYSLGVTLYFMLTGQPPFSGSLGQILSQHLYKAVPLEPLAPLPRCAVGLLQRMMEKDRAQRPQTPQALQAEVQACLKEMRSSETSEVRPTPREPLQQGVLLARNYRLVKDLGNAPEGRRFLAEDLRHHRPVSLLVLSWAFVADRNRFSALEIAVDCVRAAPHPRLRTLYALETAVEHSFVVEEAVEGPSLQEVLRTRSALSAPEVARLLSHLAPLADHAATHQLKHVDFTLRGVHLVLQAAPAPETGSALLRRPLTAWEPLELKVNAIDFGFSPLEAPTWIGSATFIQSGTDQSPQERYVRALSLLGYELLGGDRARLESTGRYTPLSALTEEGNATLRRGVIDDLPSACALAEHLSAAVDARRSLAAAADSAEPGKATSSLTVTTAKSDRRVRAHPLTVVFGAVVLIGAVVYAAIQFARQPPEEALREAEQCIETKDYVKALPLLQKAAETGSAKAMYNLGELYYYGHGVAQDYAQTRQWYQKAAEAGNAAAMNQLGELYYYGRGVSQDYTQAREWFQQAAKAGNAEAMDALGILYYHGRGVAQDYNKAREWYEKAVEAGGPDGMIDLGDLYEKGKGVAQDSAHALRLYAQALPLFEKAAKAGDARAMYELGKLYQSGRGVTRDYAKASEWYQKATDAGSADAKQALSRLGAENPDTSDEWYAKARWLYEKAAATGSAQAMNNLGRLYENGWGVAQDYALARQWYQKAAEAGDVGAMNKLGDFYKEGLGGMRDYALARQWYQKAADTGDEYAKRALSQLPSKIWAK
jgi:TPR repeat protein